MSNLNLIKKLGFTPKENTLGIYYKKYAHDYALELDFNNEKINYGHLIKSESKTTQNFSQAENGVVLECVNRLLEKGYAPKNIVLEKTWDTGHGTSGRLDILVTHDDGTAYLMIECKTYGTEFEKEFNRLKKDGGQLFTYFQQDKNASVLMLYASELKGNELVFRNEIIKIEDDYRQTGNVKDFYDRWNKLPKNNGVFDAWVSPYDFQSKALTPKSLQDIKQEDSSFIFNQFLEILRHNVVSDKSNAFNKIFTLFLCKIYDEKATKPHEELAFQWLEGKDDDISFQKRLTDLYRKGMKEFLEKEVTDLSDAEFNNKFQGIDDIIKKQFLDQLTEIRLKKNNEFAIKEVFDNASFKENGKVVKEVVELLQGFKIRYTKKQQYLSDFFELLLTTGLKQESGQFFTPVPIAQFIIKSLPIDELVYQKLKNGETNNLLPTIIDYAAGSGHFITESMHEVQRIIDKTNPDDFIEATAKKLKTWKEDHFDWAFTYVYGIEKDYRLVKVGKVGCYLHGDGLAKIVHSDGLGCFTKTPEYKDLLAKTDKDFPQDNKQFDIVVSNPPYSVSAFKNNARKYYTEKDFESYDKLTDQSSEIECLFIERTKQLLKDGGMAGIILPSSILSNSGIYTKAREIILQYFDIIAITELGSNTFMATGTNTVVLFLRRRTNYDCINIRKSVETRLIAACQDVTINGIENPLSHYIAHVWAGVNLEDYISLLKKQPNTTIQQHEHYQAYSKKIGEDLERIITIETEKLYYFILVYQQKTVLIKSGEKQTEKQFLGYEFSNRRGSEGIHPIQRGKTIEACTQLFDAETFDNPEKVSTTIYQAFKGEFDTPIHAKMSEHVFRVDLVDLFTFDRVEFEKSISLSVKKKFRVESKWELVRIKDICEIGRGRVINKKEITANKGEYPVFSSQTSNNGIFGYLNSFDFEGEYVTWTTDGVYAGSVFYRNGRFNCTNVCGTLKAITDKIYMRFLSLILPRYTPMHVVKVANPKLMNNVMGEIKIPLPPKDIQEKIVADIEQLEAKEAEIKSGIEKLINTIATIFHQEGRIENYRLSQIATLEYGKPLPKGFRVSGEYPVMGSNGIDGTHNEFLVEAPCIIVGRKGSAGKINYVQKNCFPIDTTFYIKHDANKIHIKYLYFLLQELDLEGIAKGKGIGVPGLNRNNVHALKISIHPIEQQQKIIAEITAIETQITTLENELSTLPQQKEAVLKHYLSL